MGKRAKKRKAKQIDKQARSTIELINSRNCKPDGIMTTKNGQKARLVQIATTDLTYLDDEDLAAWFDAFTDLNRVYTDPYQLISLSTRIDTSENQRYWHRLRNRLGNSPQERLRGRLITENLNRVIKVEEDADNYSEMNFYIKIFAHSTRELRQKTHLLEVSAGDQLGLKTLNFEQTREVEYRLNNPNSK